MEKYNFDEIVKALSKHKDDKALEVLERIGTNYEKHEVRETVSRALVEKNTHNALKIVLIKEGKGIHDLDSSVVESTIDALNTLEDKSEAIKILDDTITLHSNEKIKERALIVKQMLEV